MTQHTINIRIKLSWDKMRIDWEQYKTILKIKGSNSADQELKVGKKVTMK